MRAKHYNNTFLKQWGVLNWKDKKIVLGNGQMSLISVFFVRSAQVKLGSLRSVLQILVIISTVTVVKVDGTIELFRWTKQENV